MIPLLVVDTMSASLLRYSIALLRAFARSSNFEKNRNEQLPQAGFDRATDIQIAKLIRLVGSRKLPLIAQ